VGRRKPAATANKVHNLQPVFVSEDSSVPIGASNNFAVQFYSYPLRRKFEKLNQSRQRDSLVAILCFPID
jgi:hypothetical protein